MKAATTSQPAEAEAYGDDARPLEDLGLSLAKSRAEAIEARQACGIEDEWLEDEEFYAGIDDANRGEQKGAWRSKPPGRMSPTSGGRAAGSTIFLNITAPYVDSAAARIGDMLLPTDDAGWSLDATPVPDMASIADGEFPPKVQAAIERELGTPEAAQAKMAELQQRAAAERDDAKERAERAAKRIEDWHVQCQFHAHARHVIDDCARIGSGCLKGPFPRKVRRAAFVDNELVIREELEPASARIDVWNLYPDPGCGENIHNGSHIWERDDITRRQVQDLIGVDGYLEDQLRAVLREGPHKATKEGPSPDDPKHGLAELEGAGKQFEIWYYHGQLDRDDLIAAGEDPEALGEDVPVVHAQVTMINNRVVRAITNPLDTGDFPYDLMVWKRRAGLPYGSGVARAIRNAQRSVNGAARNMMDNAGRAGGPQVLIKRNLVTPRDGAWEITPWKLWDVLEDADLEHADNAFRFVYPPMLQAELQNIIMLGLRLAEDVVGLPMMLQGQMGASTPDTASGMAMLQNNATTVLRRCARLFDDLLTEPHVRRYYTFLLVHGEDDEKGDFAIDARGSSALVERALQADSVRPVLEMAGNPVYGLDPKRAAEEFLRSQRLNPASFKFDDDKWQEVVERLSQPPQQQDSSLQVAELRAQVEREKVDAKSKADELRMRMEDHHKAADRALEAAGQEMEATLATLEIESDGALTREEIKARLADTVMKLRTQRELATQRQVLTPPTEPPGRAADGQAFHA